jgi:glycosyltransferase involved in cell wall biosynthesis
MLSLVIPVYKNAESLPALIASIRDIASQCVDGLEAIFVVDGSPDESADLLRRELPSSGLPATLVELSRNFGSFAAIAAGLQQGQGDRFAVIAADLQEPPELVITFDRLLADGTADVVLGHRERRADPWLSRLTAETFWTLYRRFVVPDMPRGGVDMFGCTKQVRDRLVDLREANSSLVALLLWVGFRRASVPYERRARQHGRSAWTFGRKLRYAIDSIFNFTDIPIKLLLILGAVATALAVTASVVVSMAWAIGLVPVLGYTPLMLAITSFGGLTALGLGIVGQYLWLTLQNTRDRPAFIVRTIARFDAHRERVPQTPQQSRDGSSDRNSS